MFSWALRTLWRDRRYALAAAAGVAAALLLATLVEGMFVGESRQIIAYPGSLHADVWVAQDGVSNMHMATSFIDSGKETLIRKLPQVASTESLLYVNGFVSDGDKEWFAYVVGLHADQPEAGPDVPVHGKRMPGPGEAVIPQILAEKLGVGIGDTVEVANEPVTVVGLTDGYFSMANSIAFVDFGWLRDLLDTFNVVSYIVVHGQPGVSTPQLRKAILDHVDDVEVVDNATFLDNDLRIGLQMGGELIAIMSMVSAVVAALIVAWCVTVLVVRYQRELAIAKAVGARNHQVIAAVACQALLLAGLGYLIFLVLALGLEPGLTRWVPDVAIHFPLASFQRNAVLSLAVALVSALLPAWRVVTLDPVEVFK